MGPDARPLHHWPLASLRALGARGDAAIELAPGAESDERLVLADPEIVGAIRSVCPDLHRRPNDRRGLRRALLCGVATLAAIAAAGFVALPRLSDQLAPLIPTEREMAVGDRVVGDMRDLLAWNGDDGAPPAFCTNPDGLAAVEAMAARLDAADELPYPLRIATLDHGLVDAVALPGGRIILFRGLIEAAGSPEEVAAVLAHEIGHAAHRDPMRNLLRSAGTAGILGLVLGDVFGTTLVDAAGEAALDADHRRAAETRADETGRRLLREAGLPLSPFARFLERLAARADSIGAPLAYAAAHPGLVDSAARADRIGEGRYRPVLDDRGWVALQEICSETSGTPAQAAEIPD